jgi:sugar lactone lactonase YvrE
MKVLPLILLAGALFAQAPPKISFDSDLDFLKLPADMNFGEVLGITINSKGQIVVLNHPGTATSGPLYGNATTQLLVFDASGKYLHEMGKGVYGLGYAHSVRFDKYDNLWVVDKGTMSVMRFNPAGRVTMNLGRREEGPDEHRYPGGRGSAPPPHIDGYFNGPTDIAWDSKDNMYISDGYQNSRVAKVDKHGDWVKSWGSRGRENGQFSLPHNIGVDRQDNVYVADRNNRRIQVFDADGTWLRNITMVAPYDKKRHPTLGNVPPNLPDEAQAWTICITNTPTQYLYTSDENPGRIYKMSLDGKTLGTVGESGHEIGQFNWIHAIACPSENSLLVADMNNWRVQKLTLHPEKSK